MWKCVRWGVGFVCARLLASCQVGRVIHGDLGTVSLEVFEALPIKWTSLLVVLPVGRPRHG